MNKEQAFSRRFGHAVARIEEQLTTEVWRNTAAIELCGLELIEAVSKHFENEGWTVEICSEQHCTPGNRVLKIS